MPKPDIATVRSVAESEHRMRARIEAAEARITALEESSKHSPPDSELIRLLTEMFNEARVAERRILQAIRSEISENDQKLLDAYARRAEKVVRKLEQLDAKNPSK